MEIFKTAFCKLCLSTINDENFRVIGENTMAILDVLLPKMDTNQGTNDLLCDACSVKLLAAFQFKSTCICTDNIITRYAYCEKGTPVDLIKIFLNEKGDESIDTLDEQKVCRLCMRLVRGEFLHFYELPSDAIQKYIPEINFKVSEDPVICKLCTDSLDIHTGFVKNCLSANERMKNVCFDQDRDIKHDIPLLEVYIKTEPIETVVVDNSEKKIVEFKVKLEDEGQIQKFIKSEMLELQLKESEARSSPSLHRGSELNDGHNLEINSDVENLAASTASAENIFNCDTCSYISNCENDLRIHLRKLHDVSNVLITLKCDSCEYESKDPENLERHKLVHRDPSEIQTCTCGRCEDLTRSKQTKNEILNKMKDHLHIETLKCHLCTFEAKRKSVLKLHIFAHLDASQRPIFQCDKCGHKAKSKTGLKTHRTRHLDRSELEMFKCDLCNYEAKIKSDLTKHMARRHTPEIETYKCHSCSFETKYKYSIRNHVWTHRDPSESKVFQCDVCGHRVKDKRSLDVHKFKHRDPKELRSFSCSVCSYETKVKERLAVHFKKCHTKTGDTTGKPV